MGGFSKPSGRFGHSFVVYDDYAILFGGLAAAQRQHLSNIKVRLDGYYSGVLAVCAMGGGCVCYSQSLLSARVEWLFVRLQSSCPPPFIDPRATWKHQPEPSNELFTLRVRVSFWYNNTVWRRLPTVQVCLGVYDSCFVCVAAV